MQTSNGWQFPTLEPAAPGGNALYDNMMLLSERVPKHTFTQIINPSVTDDSTQGYALGSQWFNQLTKETFFCLNPFPGAAEWVNTANKAVIRGVELNSIAVGLTGEFQIPFNGYVSRWRIISLDNTSGSITFNLDTRDFSDYLELDGNDIGQPTMIAAPRDSEGVVWPINARDYLRIKVVSFSTITKVRLELELLPK